MEYKAQTVVQPGWPAALQQSANQRRADRPARRELTVCVDIFHVSMKCHLHGRIQSLKLGEGFYLPACHAPPTILRTSHDHMKPLKVISWIMCPENHLYRRNYSPFPSCRSLLTNFPGLRSLNARHALQELLQTNKCSLEIKLCRHNYAKPQTWKIKNTSDGFLSGWTCNIFHYSSEVERQTSSLCSCVKPTRPSTVYLLCGHTSLHLWPTFSATCTDGCMIAVYFPPEIWRRGHMTKLLASWICQHICCYCIISLFSSSWSEFCSHSYSASAGSSHCQPTL